MFKILSKAAKDLLIKIYKPRVRAYVLVPNKDGTVKKTYLKAGQYDEEAFNEAVKDSATEGISALYTQFDIETGTWITHKQYKLKNRNTIK